jgi:hypothetical protein
MLDVHAAKVSIAQPMPSQQAGFSCIELWVKCVRGARGWAGVLQKAFSAHARAVVQVRVDLAHVAEVAMRLVLLEPLLLNAVVDAE